MKLETSVELLERVRAKNECSWWALSKVIPASESTVNNWKHGRSAIGREYVTRIAELLDEPAEYVLACVEHEREQDAGARKLWHRIAAKFRSHAASILLTGLLGALLAHAGKAEVSVHSQPAAARIDCILWKIAAAGRRLARWAALKNNNARPLLRGLWARIRSWACGPRSWSGSPAYT